ncbi:hypothetical protein H0H87_007436 [Tephrocybe sp. NHM501043]|nr:hypothetical protein H0H87_007436 [Tephrocybe sp. NHM501043]
MLATPNLDDPNQISFCIPFAPDNEEEIPFSPHVHQKHDIPEGEKLRIEAYTTAWRKCLDRIKIAASTDAFDLDDANETSATALTSHLYLNDCISLASAMKNLIAGFVDRPHILEKVRGRSAVSLVSYDMDMLLVWYTAIRDAYAREHQPKLVIILHDFEQLDPLIVQDIFTISSLYIPRLPLVFILSLSSPAYLSFLHSTYPKATLALLRLSTYAVPSGEKVLEKVLLGTFFDIEFEPDLIIGPSVLIYLTDYYNRHNLSLDAALSILHLAHMKHFSGEPLTLLVRSTPASDILAQQSSFSFVEKLTALLQSSQLLPTASNLESSKQSMSSLISAIDDARTAVYSRARRLRVGFGIAKLVHDFMIGQGYKGLGWGDLNIDVMILALQGGLGPDIKYLGVMVKKLRATQLAALFSEMHSYFSSLPWDGRSGEEEARTNLVMNINALPPQQTEDNDVTGAISQIAAKFGDWLVNYLKRLINPSLRATIIAGLLQPHDFADTRHRRDDDQAELSLWELPDASILFHRYLNSGKMLNLYDWFLSFQLELETQRKNLKERAAVKARSLPSSPRKRGEKDKAKARAREEHEKEEVIEKWHMELQARFMQAMQDLDYLGFIKHTGQIVLHQPTGLLYLACSTHSSRTAWTPAADLFDSEHASFDDYVATYDPSSGRVTRLKFVHFESERGFSAHGMDVVQSSSNSEELFVYLINHRAPLNQSAHEVGADTSVEVFKTVVGSDTLTYIRTFEDPQVIICPNDVIGYPDGQSFYFTNDHSIRVGLFRALELFRSVSSVGYCNAQTGCKPAITKMQSTNGIARAENDTIYVTSLSGSISFLERQSDNTLVVTDTVSTDRVLDNVSIDLEGALWVAGFPNVFAWLKHFSNPTTLAASSGLRISINTGESSFYGEKHKVDKVTTPGLAYICLGGFVVAFSMFSLLVKEKFYINEVVLGTAFGILMGPHVADIFDPRSWGPDSTFITREVTRIVLATGLFAIGVELPKSYMAKHAKSLLVMVVPTMAIGWVIVAGDHL